MQGQQRSSVVCDHCRIKKQKCNSAYPACSGCAYNGTVCTYTTPTIKRGRKKADAVDATKTNYFEFSTRSNAAASPIEQTTLQTDSATPSLTSTSTHASPTVPSADAENSNVVSTTTAVIPSSTQVLRENEIYTVSERSYCLDIYKLYTYLDRYDDIDGGKIIQPSDPADRMLLSIVMAWSYRAAYNRAKADEHIKDALAASALIYDDVSVKSIAAFGCLSDYYISVTSKSFTYMSVSLALMKQLPSMSLHMSQLYKEAVLSVTTHDPSLSKQEKSAFYASRLEDETTGTCNCSKCSGMPKQIQYIILSAFSIILLKTGALHHPTAYIEFLRAPLSEEEKRVLLTCGEIFLSMPWGGASYTWQIIFATLKAVVLFLGNEVEESKEMCMKIVDILDHDSMAFTMFGNTGPLVLLCALLLQLGMASAANTVGRKLLLLSNDNTLDQILKLLELDWPAILEPTTRGNAALPLPTFPLKFDTSNAVVNVADETRSSSIPPSPPAHEESLEQTDLGTYLIPNELLDTVFNVDNWLDK